MASGSRHRLVRYGREVLSPLLLLKSPASKHPHQLPTVEKIAISANENRLLTHGKTEAMPHRAAMELLTGRKWHWTVARKSVANFKQRKGDVTGTACTLKGHHAMSFLEKWIYILGPQESTPQPWKGGVLGKGKPEIRSFHFSVRMPKFAPEWDKSWEYFKALKAFNVAVVCKVPRGDVRLAASMLSGMQVPGIGWHGYHREDVKQAQLKWREENAQA